MRRQRPELIIVLCAALACFNRICVCVPPTPTASTTNATTSNFDALVNVSSGKDVTAALPDVALLQDNEAVKSASSVAKLSVGNKTVLAISSVGNSNSSNSTVDDFNNATFQGHKKIFHFFRNKGAMLRAFYVAVGVLVIVTIYTFVVSRLKRRKTKRHMYGLLTKHTDVELTPLGQDEEEDEHTVFDAVQYKS